ncbi:MAG: threonine ammonia-lyase [Candidatus Rokubacteria bacterium]|nr:threonine ammonia-lyase [Candidatus Rokubacteria bacterium]
MPVDLPTIEAARERLRGAVAETPCAFSATLSELTGTRCFIKLENLHVTGSFKERGAANFLLQLPGEARSRGVATASAGNHGLALAFHAARLGVPATIVMPEWAPLIKIASARRHGAEVILCGADFDEAYAHAVALAAGRGLAFVHPFDDERVIAGQGTLGLELLEQRPDMDAVLVPIGGGGLIGGVGIAVKGTRPSVRIIGVQTAAVPAMARAVESGRSTVPAAPTIADGIAVREVGALTLPLARALVDHIVTVREEELANAILRLLETEKTVAEGAGAAPLAALLNRPLDLAGATVVLVLSGGNIDVTMLARIIERGLVQAGRLVRLVVVLRDRPGALARVTALVAEERGNVVHIAHDRAFSRWVAIGETEVELTLETSGRAHAEAMIARLRVAGYRVEERTG